MDQPQKSAESSSNLDIGVKVEANLNPLVNATPRALGTIFNLLFGKKYTEAARQSLLSAAQNHVDSQKILEGKATFNRENGALIESTSGHNEIRMLVREAIQEEEITNLISCTIHAANDTKDELDSSEVEVSSEFLNRWRNEAKFISEEAAQAIWGRILSEEVKAPNSVSIRTLEVIKSLTREEAEAFREACKFVFFDEYLLDTTVDGNPIPQTSYVMMKDAGLIVSYQKGFYTSGKWPETNIGFEGKPTAAYYLRVGKLFMYVEKEQVTEPPSASYWMLTKAGKEMCRIISREIEFDTTALGEALVETYPQLRSLLKYTYYTNTDKQLINLNTVRNVF